MLAVPRHERGIGPCQPRTPVGSTDRRSGLHLHQSRRYVHNVSPPAASAPSADLTTTSPAQPPNLAGTIAARAFTALLVIGPAVALGLAIPLLWGRVVHLHDIVLAVIFYLVSGFGVTVGYHRLFTHRGFTPTRALKIVLAGYLSTSVRTLSSVKTSIVSPLTSARKQLPGGKLASNSSSEIAVICVLGAIGAAAAAEG